MVYAPVEAIIPYDINLVLRKTCFICDVMETFFRNEDKSVQMGENHFKSGHALECCVCEGQLVGSVRASMKDKT